MPYIIMLSLFLFTGCFHSSNIVIPYKEITVKKTSSNGYISNKETPFFFEYEDYVLGAIFWQDINDIQPVGRLLFSLKDNHQILLDNKIFPCDKHFYKGVDTVDSFIIKDELCIEKIKKWLID